MANQVVQKEDQFPTDLLDELTATAGEGTTFESSELQIPFIRIIQALSRQTRAMLLTLLQTSFGTEKTV
jgi:hypothetical protein